MLMGMYRNIDRDRLQFDFLVEYEEPQFYDAEIERLGGHVYRTSVREDKNLIKYKRDLRRFFEEHGEYQTVHCHTYTVGDFVLGEAERAGIPIRIAHAHNNSMTRDIKSLPKRFMLSRFANHATDLMACSEEAGHFQFGNEPFKVIKNGIDAEIFRANADVRQQVRNSLGIADGTTLIGNVGRLHEQKNQKFALEVFASMRKARPDAHMLLVGSGPLEEELREHAQSLGLSFGNVGSDVILLQNRSDMCRLYQAMDAFLLPSLFEGLGIVAIEAQAAGVPCLCSETVSRDAAVTPLFHTLTLWDPPEVWAEWLGMLADPSKAHENMTRLIAEAGYDIKEVARDMQDWYLEYCWK